MTGLDDLGTIAPPLCPLCEGWAVTVDLDDVPWPEAGALVEAAIDEHVESHSRAITSLDCGCRITVDEGRDLAWLDPCSQPHRLIASLNRKPGSRIIVN